MSAIEKLWVQIFERKSWIIDQAKQQTLQYDKHLASKLLIEGIAPPPWIWTSDSTELNGEDLISGVLLSRPRPLIPFAFSHCSVYEKPIAEATNGELPNGSCSKASVENRELDGLDHARRASVCVENRDCGDFDHAECASVGVSTLDHCNTFVDDQRKESEDASITSPQEQRETGFLDVSHDTARSLAKIQRSKSRQKALELRTSTKAAKSRLKNVINSGENIPIPSFHDDQPDQINLVKPVVDTSNNICTVEIVKVGDPCSKGKESFGWKRSSLTKGRSSNVVGEDGIAVADSIGPFIQQSNIENQPPESVNNFQIAYENHMAAEAKVGENMSKEKGSGPFKIVRENRAALTDSTGPSIQQSDRPLESTNHFKSGYENCMAAEANVGENRSQEKGGGIDRRRITRSKSSAQQTNHVNELFKMDGTRENHMATEAKVGENMNKEKGSDSSNVVREDRAAFTDSIGPSLQQPDRPSEYVNHFQSRYNSCIAAEAKVEEKRVQEKGGNIEGRRITRSRSSAQQTNLVNELFKMDGTSKNHMAKEVKVDENRNKEKGSDSCNLVREDGAAPTDSIGPSLQQFDRSPESANHFQSYYDSCIAAEANVEEQRDQEKEGSIEGRRITRSRSFAQKTSRVNELFKMDGTSENHMATEVKVDENMNREKGSDSSNAFGEAAPTDSIGSLLQQSDQPSESANRFQSCFSSCIAAEANVEEKRGQEKGGSIEGKRITRSRSSAQQTNCVNELFKMDGTGENHMATEVKVDNNMNKEKGSDSSNVVREDRASHTGSIGPSIQQSNPPSESAKYFQSRYKNRIAAEANVEENRSQEKGGSIEWRRMTRSRSSVKQANRVNELFKMDGTSDSEQKIGSGSLTRQESANHSQTVKSAYITNESCGLKAKVGGSRSSFRRVTRSRSSSQPNNTVYDLSQPVKFSTTGTFEEEYLSRSTGSQGTCTIEKISEPANFNVSGHITTDSVLSTSNSSQKDKDSQISAEIFSPIREDQELHAANSTECSDEENIIDECVGKNTITSLNKGTSELVNSQNLDLQVTRSKSASSNEHLETKSLNSSESLGHNKVSCNDLKDSPSSNTSKPANSEGCAATVTETAIHLDEQVESHRVGSGSNLNGARAVGVEVCAQHLADSTKHVEPKQLNFDDVETSGFNGVSALSVEKDTEGRLLERSPQGLSEFAAVLDTGIFLEEREVLSKERKLRKGSSEACVEDADTDIIALNGHAASAVKETPQAEKGVATHSLQHCDKSSKEKSSLIDPLVTLQVARESETETTTPVTVIPAEVVSADRPETTSSVDLKLSIDADFTRVTTPVPFEIQEACTDPCSVSKDGNLGNLAQSTENSEHSQFRTADSLKGFTHDATDVTVSFSQSTKRQTAAKSVEKTSFSALLEGSTRNKRKRSGSLDALPTSPVAKENAVFPVVKDTKVRNLSSEEHGFKDVLESPDLQIPQDDIQLDISKSQVEGMPQSEEDDMQERSKSSLRLLVQEDGCSLKDGDLSATNLVTSADEELESFHISSVVRKSAGACDGLLMEEARVEDPSSIIFDGISLCTLEENKLPYHLEDNFQIRNADSLTYSEPLHFTGADETMPVLESFILQSDDEQPCIADERIRFDKLSLPKTSIEHASILEQLCRSACLQTPVSCSSASYKLPKISNLYQSVPTGLLEGMDKPKDDYGCLSEVFNCSFEGRSYSDFLPNSTSQCDWEINKPCLSPVRKVWDRIISKSDSSEKRRSVIPELPSICEENENVDEVADTSLEGNVSKIQASSVKRAPLAEVVANLAASEAEQNIDRSSLDSVSTEFSFNGTHKRTKQNVGNGKGIKRRYNNKENDSMSSLGGAASKGKTGLLHNRFSKSKVSSTRTSSRRGGPSLTATEPKPSNIVSNITSFIPLVQQKQAAAVITGKRDVKVKALGAAEAARRLAEKKDNERKAKKEAMKLERARLEQENLRQLELQKKQKEVERKKKEAEMAAKKRQREEEERKEKDRKRMRVEETRKQQRENEQKLHAQKEEKDAKYRALDVRGQETKESKDEKRNHKMEQQNGDENLQRLSEAEHATTQASTSDDREPSIIREDTGISSDHVKNLNGNNLDKPTGADNLVATASVEQSYDISPYKCSDDEDEEDDVPNNKFVPSWARKPSVALFVASQDRVDPETIFPPDSFCSIAEVLLPRKYQINVGGT
ncbi:uncharacterized protein LOC133783311 isoform X2 [Humulus lupulus]|uniref:uncharacterized protein LOC133783311 isoform X2 n=1 Tax=Humulus lupulus TaxID=3486 RepID=UPI002B403DFA|nr:uncharacterized protein LOC133783311 isoform X2 [Humulus lupulus]